MDPARDRPGPLGAILVWTVMGAATWVLLLWATGVL